MKFLIVTHVIHTKKDGKYYGYGPYIKEMNLWLKYVDNLEIIAPLLDKTPDKIDLFYEHKNLRFTKVPAFNLIGIKNKIYTFLTLPYIFLKIFIAMYRAEHIHLRCPGNMGLIGVLVQIFFPWKIKTAKYAGNWDPNSRQPWSYRLQKWILGNTFLSRNIKVLVYGEWAKQSKNIVPFFTASYHESENELCLKSLDGQKDAIHLIYVGALSLGKRPLLSIEAAQKLKLMHENLDVRLDMFGEGLERSTLESYVVEHQLEENVFIHGNQSAQTVKEYYKNAHFLIFASRSEGWPKVVAEAMFWGCLPITTDVSCVSYMIGDGKRGKIIEPDVNDIVEKIEAYLENPDEFEKSSRAAMYWSREFTLEKFEEEIGKVLHDW